MSNKLRLVLVLAGTLFAQKTSAEGHEPRTDLFGDLLPPGALARMGTIRFAQGDAFDGAPALTPDHKTFAAASCLTPYRQGRTVCIWDAATGKELRHLDDPDFEHYQAFFLKRENLLGTLGIARKSGQGGKHVYAVQFWDPKTGKKVADCFQVAGGFRIEPYALSPDEKLLVSANISSPVTIRDRKSGKVLAEWNGNSARVFCLGFSPDGKTVAIGTAGTFFLWDWQANREARRFSDIRGPSVQRVWYSADGRWIAAYLFGEWQGVRIWDTKGLKEVQRFAGEENIRFFPDGKKIVSAITGKIWDIASGKQVGRLEDCAHCLTLDFSADGRSVNGYALGSLDYVGARGRLRRWDADTGKDRSPPTPAVHRAGINHVGFLPDGKSVVSVSSYGDIRVWDAATGKEKRTLEEGIVRPLTLSTGIFARVAADGTIVTTRGKRLAFFREGGKVKEIDLEGDTASLNLSSDGKTLIWSGGRYIGNSIPATNRLVQLWDIASKKMVDRCTVPEETGLESLNVSADRQRIAAYVNRAVVLLNASGTVEQTLGKRPERVGRNGRKAIGGDEGHAYISGVQALAFSPTEDVLASAGHLGSLKLFDLRSGKVRHALTLSRHYAPYELHDMVFSPNGRMIAAESSDGVVDVWETSTGQLRRRFRGHRSYHTTLAFAPDNVRLATGNRDATILIWDVFGLWTGTAADAAPVTEKELPELWKRLREPDAEKACRIIGRLMRSPALSSPFLRRQLLCRKEIETVRLRAWIADLDDDNFNKRETASKELAKHVQAAEPLLKASLANKPSLEMRRRIEKLLSLLESQPLSAETIRDLRALEVLEYFGLAALGELTRELVKGAYDPHIAAAAKAACQRLRMQTP